MNKEEWEEYITWEERVTDKLERWVKYNKPITREQAEETIDFICEQDNVIDRKIRELEKYKNIIEIMEKYFELINDLAFDYDGLNEEKSLKALIDELKKYASLGRAYNITEPIYENNGKKYNILNEELKGE